MAGGVALASLCVATVARGQPADDPFGGAADDPFGGLDDPAMEDAAPAAGAYDAIDAFGAPAGQPDPAVQRRSTRPAGEAAPIEPAEPAVLAILESKPKTSAELLRAIDILVDLDAAAVAKPFADELGQRNLTGAEKAALVDGIHPAKLLKLSSHGELGVVLGPMVDDWLGAAEEYRRDRQRLATAAGQLSDPDPAVHEPAAVALLRARESAVAPLVAILADPNRAAEHAAARQVLLYLNGFATAPLLGVLESPDPHVKRLAIELLGQLGAHEGVPQLLGPLASPSSSVAMRAAASRALEQILGRTPDRQKAIGILERAVRGPLEKSLNDAPETAAPAILWHWNRKQNESMPVEYDQTGAELAKATRLARDLVLIDPSRADWRRQYLLATLQAAKLRAGLSRPLASGETTAYGVAAYYGADIVDDLLAHAMADGYIPAATGAAQILGDIGSSALLIRGGARPSPLADAAGHPDGRLRFAAIEAIMKLESGQAFAGSSAVANGLGFFASSFGVPRVLVAHPNSAEAQTLAGLAAALGYETDIATNGREAFELAVRWPDYDFALIHSHIDRPEFDHLVGQLRRDRRPSLLPLGLVAPADELQRVGDFAHRTPRAEAFVQPENEAQMKVRASQLLDRAGRWHLSAAERKAQATAALDWLAELAARPQRVFDVYRQEPAVVAALYMPELTTRATAVLAELGTATSQRSLLELADLPTQPLVAREAAAAAFARNVEQFGLRLTRNEIMHQYDLYNSNAGRDGETHSVLSTVLDAIEPKNRPAGGR